MLKDKIEGMGLHPSFMSWIMDCLTGRPQFVRLGHCVSEMLVYSTVAPQVADLTLFLFTLYTYFKYNSESCNIQKYSDDATIVACYRKG